MSSRLKPARIRHAWRRIAMVTWGEPNDPTVYGTLEVDATAALAYIEELRAHQPVKVGVVHLVGRALALAIAKRPEINARISFGRMLQRDTVDIFFQVATEGGEDLSGAKVDAVETLSVLDVAEGLATRASRIRERKDPQFESMRKMMKKLPQPLLKLAVRGSSALVNHLDVGLPQFGMPRDPFGSAMVSNIGSFALETGFAPLLPMAKVPLIILVGRVNNKAVVVEDADGGEPRVEIRPILKLCATFDHRILDGFQAGELAKDVKAYFADPAAHETA